MWIAARGVPRTQKDKQGNKDSKNNGPKKNSPPILLHYFFEACSIKKENNQNSWVLLTVRKGVSLLGECSKLRGMTKNPGSYDVISSFK